MEFEEKINLIRKEREEFEIKKDVVRLNISDIKVSCDLPVSFIRIRDLFLLCE